MFKLVKFITGVFFLKGRNPLRYPRPTYTNNDMALTCENIDESIDVGQISGSEWKFKGRRIKNSGRFKITTSDTKSVLIVGQVIRADAGKSKLAEFVNSNQ